MQDLCSSALSLLSRRLNVVRRLLLFSSAATDASATHSPSPGPGFLADYLVSSLGFSAQKAAKASRRLRRVQSTQQPESVLDFFRDHGFEDAHLKELVARHPGWLALDVEKSLAPRFRAFQELGFSGDSLIHLVLSNPSIIKHSLDHVVVPKIKLWKQLLGSDKRLMKCCKERQRILVYNVEKKILPNAAMLRSYGFSDRGITLIVSKHPNFILQKQEALKALIDRAERVGVCRGSSNIHWVLWVLYMVGQEKFHAKVEVMKSFGWSEDDVLAVFRRSPCFFTISAKSLKEKMDFLVKEAGCDPSYIARSPFLLTLSLEKRLMPRLRVLKALKSKDVLMESHNLSSPMFCTEKNFLDKYVLKYKAEFPELSNVYTTSIRSSFCLT